MSQLGLGVMINNLGNHDSVNAFKSSVGKIISKLEHVNANEKLVKELKDGKSSNRM